MKYLCRTTSGPSASSAARCSGVSAIAPIPNIHLITPPLYRTLRNDFAPSYGNVLLLHRLLGHRVSAHGLCNSSGSFVTFPAIRRASSLVRSLVSNAFSRIAWRRRLAKACAVSWVGGSLFTVRGAILGTKVELLTLNGREFCIGLSGISDHRQQ